MPGGERSFSTVAFALAVGEWTSNPFRAMDEFDVFMDGVNRENSVSRFLADDDEHAGNSIEGDFRHER